MKRSFKWIYWHTTSFIYRDAEDNTTNVIYRREDGDIGLLEVKE